MPESGRFYVLFALTDDHVVALCTKGGVVARFDTEQEAQAAALKAEVVYTTSYKVFQFRSPGTQDEE